MAKREEQKEKGPDMPKLTQAHFLEITELIKKYGGVNKVMQYWHAVMLDEQGNVVAILDHSEHDEYTMAKFEALEPLKGIKYIGAGFLNYVPYTWCTEWIRQWEWWVGENKHLAVVKPLLATPERIKSFRDNFNKVHAK